VNLNLKCDPAQHGPRETNQGLGPAQRLISALALALIASGPMGPSSAAPLTKHLWHVMDTGACRGW